MTPLRCIWALVVVVLAGCCGTSEFVRPVGTSEPWDTTYLLDMDPGAVTDAELEAAVSAAESRLDAATVDGVVWPRLRSSAGLDLPDQYVSGGDSLLFTGLAAASRAWRYRVTGRSEDLDAALSHVRGLRLLTSATGVPGVLCRCAFPMARAAEFGWPWPTRVPFVGEHDGYGYYTRATRDQLTGLVLGLSAVWAALDGDAADSASECRLLLRAVGRDVLARLEADDWNIRDAHGANDTGADHVDGLLRLSLEAFVATAEYRPLDGVAARVRDCLGSISTSLESWVNRFSNTQQYFAHNLRVMRSLALALLLPGLRAELLDYAQDAWWRYVLEHHNAWFGAAWMAHGGEEAGDIRRDLASWSLRPARSWSGPYAGQEQGPGYGDALLNCTGGYVVDPQLRKPSNYWVWQKEPWDTGIVDHLGLGDDLGLSLVAPYWLWRMVSR